MVRLRHVSAMFPRRGASTLGGTGQQPSVSGILLFHFSRPRRRFANHLPGDPVASKIFSSSWSMCVSCTQGMCHITLVSTQCLGMPTHVLGHLTTSTRHRLLWAAFFPIKTIQPPSRSELTRLWSQFLNPPLIRAWWLVKCVEPAS